MSAKYLYSLNRNVNTFVIVSILSNLAYILYCGASVWMFFCTLICLLIQITCWVEITDSKLFKAIPINEVSESKIDKNKKNIHTTCILIIICMLLDLFPIYAMFDWPITDGSNPSLFWDDYHGPSVRKGIPQYEGGILVFFMIIGMLFIWGNILYEILSPWSSAKNQAFINKDEYKIERELRQKEEELATTINNNGGRYKKIYDGIYLDEINKLIWINDEKYNYSDIVHVNNISSSNYDYSTELKTKTGSLVSRSIIGGVIVGPIGALLGGLTAKKTSSTFISSGDSFHTIEIYIGENEDCIQVFPGYDSDAAYRITREIRKIINMN